MNQKTKEQTQNISMLCEFDFAAQFTIFIPPPFLPIYSDEPDNTPNLETPETGSKNNSLNTVPLIFAVSFIPPQEIVFLRIALSLSYRSNSNFQTV